MSNSLWPYGPARLLCPWDSPGKNTEVGCHFLLQGNFPTQVSNLGLLHCRSILYNLSCTRQFETTPLPQSTWKLFRWASLNPACPVYTAQPVPSHAKHVLRKGSPVISLHFWLRQCTLLTFILSASLCGPVWRASLLFLGNCEYLINFLPSSFLCLHLTIPD